jgi:hypothetical protein
MDWEEACQIFGVAPTASAKDIEDKWIFWVNVLHPDRTSHLTEKLRKEAEERFKLVNQAHEVLKDPSNNPFTNPPKLKVSPKHIRFKDVETGQKKTTTFEIDSIGGAYTNIWFEAEPSPWLSVTSSKSTTAKYLPMEFTIECTGIGEPGKQYSCKLPVRLENEKTQLKDEVVLEIELWIKAERPVLYTDIARIEFKQVMVGTREAQNFGLSNVGHGVLEGTISTSKPWLSVLPGSVSLAQDERHSYSVVVNTDNLPSGFAERGEVYIRTNGGNTVLIVDLSVAQFIKEQQRNYPVKEFAKRFFLILAIPFIPPILVGTIYLLAYWQNPLFWVGVAIYGVVAVILADRKAREEEKRAMKVIAPLQRPPIIVTPRQPQPHIPRAPQSSPHVVANTFSLVYHRPSCKWARKISRSKRAYITKDEARRRGYYPCSVCRP